MNGYKEIDEISDKLSYGRIKINIKQNDKHQDVFAWEASNTISLLNNNYYKFELMDSIIKVECPL